MLEIAIALLSVVHGENKMDFDAEYKKADSTVGAVLTSKAKQSGAADIQRSIRERKRRMRVNILETELSRLAMHGRNGKASKCAILEQACSALGNPVPDLSDDDEDDDE